jgi:hypothetical protein
MLVSLAWGPGHEIMTVEEVAAFLKVHPTTFYKLVKARSYHASASALSRDS